MNLAFAILGIFGVLLPEQEISLDLKGKEIRSLVQRI